MQEISHTQRGIPEQKARNTRQNFKSSMHPDQWLHWNSIFMWKTELRNVWNAFVWFFKESFNTSLPDSALVGWAEKSQQFNCLLVCSSWKSDHCPVSMDIHGRRSRKNSLRRALAAIQLWLKANAFYSNKCSFLLLCLVCIKLIWKSSTMVVKGIWEKKQLPWEEQTLQGALKCHILSCCSSPLTEWLRMQPWKRQLPDTTDNV